MSLPCRLYVVVSSNLSNMFIILENHIPAYSTHVWSFCHHETPAPSASVDVYSRWSYTEEQQPAYLILPSSLDMSHHLYTEIQSLIMDHFPLFLLCIVFRELCYILNVFI